MASMQLTDHDLKQINQEYLASLSPGHLLHLSGKLLDDLRDARDRLNQTPQNSSRPSGSYAPWEQAANADKEHQADETIEDAAEDGAEKQAAKPEESEEDTRAADHQQQAETVNTLGENKRKRGKQPSAKGVGREVSLAVTGEIMHKATNCAGCGENFAETTPFQATTARYMLEIERTERGLEVSHVKHNYGEQRCG
jgi:transposase